VEATVIILVLVALLLLFILFKTAVVVPQQSAFVVERLGRYSATLNAGFHLLVPFVDAIRYRHSLKAKTEACRKVQIGNYQFAIAKGKELVETAEARLEAAKLSADWCKWGPGSRSPSRR